jgi:uncharacterized protein
MLIQNKRNQSEPLHSSNEKKNRTAGNALVDLLLLALRPQSVPGNSPTVGWIKRNQIPALVSLAYALSWIGLMPIIRNPRIALQADLAHAKNPAILVYVFIGVLGCLWAALIVAGAVGGVSGRYQLLRGYLKWRVGFQWYLAALLAPVVISAVAMGLDLLQTGSAHLRPVQTVLPFAIVPMYFLTVTRYMFGNFEEICWRASVLPRLQARYSALVSSLVVGIIQGFWHIPFLFVKGHYVQIIGLPAIVLQSMAMGIVATWIYNNTRGSLLLVALFHAAYDSLSQWQGTDVNLFYLSIGVWCVAALLLVIVFGARHLSHKSDSELSYAIYAPQEM